MTTEELEAAVNALQDSVLTLENTMQVLTTNLAANNSRYLQALDGIVQAIGTQEVRDAVSGATAGICTSIPPGCGDN